MEIREDNTDVGNFTLEKILTISAREYCESVGKPLSDYEFFGVHLDKVNYWANPTEYFAELVPSEAEVVVNYSVQRSFGSSYEDAKSGQNAKWIQFTAHGTALIPKTLTFKK